MLKNLNPLAILKFFKPVQVFNPLPETIVLETPVWVTARGKSIPVRSMTTRHINNCVACLEGRGNMTIPADYLGGTEKWLAIFRQELIQRQ